MKRRPVVAVDLDGTLTAEAAWQGVGYFGDLLPGAREFLTQLREFADVVIHTCRANPELGRGEGPAPLKRRIVCWLEDNHLPYDDVWGGVGKPIADAYIGDRAVSCRPEDDPLGTYSNTLRLVRLLVGGQRVGSA